MAKVLGTCKLCNGTKLLNYADLCKRCNAMKESTEIKSIALKEREAEAEAAAKQAKKEEDMNPTQASDEAIQAAEAKDEKKAEGKDDKKDENKK